MRACVTVVGCLACKASPAFPSLLLAAVEAAGQGGWTRLIFYERAVHFMLGVHYIQ